MKSDRLEIFRYFTRRRDIQIRFFACLGVSVLLLITIWLSLLLTRAIDLLEINHRAGQQVIVAQETRGLLIKDYEQYKDALNIVYEKVSAEWSQTAVVKEIESMAQSSSVEVLEQSFFNDQRESAKNQFIKIKAGGSYFQLKKFLHDLEEVRGLSKIKSFTLSGSERGNRIILDLTMEVYKL